MHISAELAKKLKTAGLTWKPALHDFFMVPDTAVADRLFVLADMMAGMEVLQGYQAITFNGATEWALDYVLMMEALWVPTEAQARTLLEQQLDKQAQLSLARHADGYTCEITLAEAPLAFSAASAADAYGEALLALLTKASA